MVLLPDNDEAGESHARDVARKLSGVARSIRVVRLPGLSTKGDVSDWFAAGGTAEGLGALTARAPEWAPTAEGPGRDEGRESRRDKGAGEGVGQGQESA